MFYCISSTLNETYFCIHNESHVFGAQLLGEEYQAIYAVTGIIS